MANDTKKEEKRHPGDDAVREEGTDTPAEEQDPGGSAPTGMIGTFDIHDVFEKEGVKKSF